MANSKGNMEIMDVLSSIRRLVSEDRRIPSAGRTEPALRGPVAEAGLATGGADDDQQPNAMMVDAVIDATVPVADGLADDPVQAEAEAAALAAGTPRRAGESRFVLTAALRVGEEEDDTARLADLAADDDGGQQMPPARPRGKPARDLASLEDTIAELEAAVAGIEEEFEPDGGDAPAHAEPASVGSMPGWPVAERALPVAGSFQGIMAGFEAMPMADDRLDLPITGDVTVPAARRSEDRQGGTGLGGGFFRATVRSSDSAAGTAGFDAAPLVPDVALPRDATLPDHAVAPDETDAGDGPGAEKPTVATQREAAADDMERAFSRPIILRPRMPEPDPVPAADAALPEVETGPEAEPEAARAETDPRIDDDLTAEDRDVDGAEEGDLFDPLADADFDIDTLRDMVAEIVRDELRGTLGERITRNLRGLVRREIERVLIAEGLKRG